ncbi:MAG: secondary thiamine-phosphate synthase enzyme YjbQ [Vulcanimicrobiota bacterium]
MEFGIRTNSRSELQDITGQVQKAVTESGIKDGICVVYTPHTTAGITINEGADPDVVKDILKQLDSVIPWNAGYAHMEGNSAAHIKSSLFGCSEQLLIENRKIGLGTWQKIYFCEFDGPRSRKVWVKVLGK